MKKKKKKKIQHFLHKKFPDTTQKYSISCRRSSQTQHKNTAFTA